MRCKILALAVLVWLLPGSPTEIRADAATEQVLKLQDSNGNVRFLICRPATEEEIAWNPISEPLHVSSTLRQAGDPKTSSAPAPAPTSPAISSAPVASSLPVSPKPAVSSASSRPASPAPAVASVSPLPVSPLPASPVPAVSPEPAVSSTPVSPGGPLSSPRSASSWLDNCGPSGAQRFSLYADPNDIICAWQFYVPRENAFAPREFHGPDPAVYNRLPDMKPVPRPIAPKPQAASTQTSGASAAASPAPASASGLPSAATISAQGQANPLAATPGSLPAALLGEEAAAQRAVEVTVNVPAQSGQNAEVTISAPVPPDLLNMPPVLPSAGSRPRNGLN